MTDKSSSSNSQNQQNQKEHIIIKENFKSQSRIYT